VPDALELFIVVVNPIARRRAGGVRSWFLPGFMLLCIARAAVAMGADLKDAQKEFLDGHYDACIALCRASTNGPDDEDWPLLQTRALLATGRYPEALATVTNALAQNATSIRLRWQAREALLCNGQTDAAADVADGVIRRVSRHEEEYRDAPNLVVLGQAALVAGADPKRVLDTLFESAHKADPASREVYLAIGALALDKHDYALAAKRFGEGLKQLPDDPDLHCGMAQASAQGDPALALSELATALGRNSNHVGSLLLLVDHNVDAEDYDGAAELLDRIEEVNPWMPDAWAYRAVLAHLQNQPDAETAARQKGLKFWATNPRVDYVIGLKLSQNYRFAEAANHQRQALEFDPDYLPAKAQLAQDLLRLGEEGEGWRLAEEVRRKDGYDVEAYNLSGLRQTMQGYATLTNRNFVLRMARHEAAVYGERALALLDRARSNLCAKYGVELAQPAVVEVFSDQKDFAVRTFGMPGNPGYLGVCFGRVVTANSPAAHPAHPVNWEDVLWHEFCHVVTLQITHNKMPRWLSEGISVYEERQASPAWGERMDPDYREMILGGELTPVSQLSGAFLAPPSAAHLQFAYYESSLVVEFLVERFGFDRLKGILRDLGEGVEINHAIENHTGPMAQIETDFAAFARERAEKMAPGLDFEKPGIDAKAAIAARGNRRSSRRESETATNAPVRIEVAEPPGDDEVWQAWAKEHPTNFWVMARQSRELAKAEKWQEAQAILEKLVTLYPGAKGPDSAWRLLAEADRQLGNTNGERQVLLHLAGTDDTALDAYRRLMELDLAAGDWRAVAGNAERYLAVDPLVPLPHHYLAEASEQTGDNQTAIAETRSVLELDPADPAQVHFDLARLLHRTGSPEARRQVLQALEDAPRYRAALRLLLEIEDQAPQTKIDSTPGVAEAAR
jgi:tetratricopeptide (TPR) repeat protein